MELNFNEIEALNLINEDSWGQTVIYNFEVIDGLYLGYQEAVRN